MLKLATKEQIEWMERQLPPAPTWIVLAYAGHHALREWKAVLPMTDERYRTLSKDQLEQQIKASVPSVVAYHVVNINEPVEQIQA